MKLSEVVPWGRSLKEYRLMFDLSDRDLHQRILGCGDGPASVNAEMKALGLGPIISVDPLYAFSKLEIEHRVRETYEKIIGQVKQNAQRYLWNHFASPDELGKARLAAMDLFLGDYESGKAESRYVFGELPDLLFDRDEFDLSLCSHLLFLYSEQLSLDFHVAALLEQLRVAREVRVFPLYNLACERSPHLDPACDALRKLGHSCELIRVPHEFQRGADQMLRVTRKTETS